MLEVIEKLLILQDRDRKLRRVEGELAHIGPERLGFKGRTADAQAGLEAAKTRVKQIESSRKSLEIEVEEKKNLIIKYANQQFQTRKNEEYRALQNEIEGCKQAITKIEDQEIELMEQAESAQKDVARANQVLAEAKKLADDQISQLDQREVNLKKELTELQANRAELAQAVDDTTRSRYERLVRTKGENVVVGVQHGMCGGCHMKLPAQILVSCQASQEITACTNCGRLLYYTRDMDLAVAD